MKADRAVSPEFKQAGSRVYVVPAEKDEQDLPVFPKLRANFEKIRQLTAAGKVRAAQSIGVGGIAAASQRWHSATASALRSRRR